MRSPSALTMNARERPFAATTSTTALDRSFGGSSAQMVPLQANVADAVIAPNPGGIVTDAVAVELAVEPTNALLNTSVALPTCGVTRTLAVVPGGMFEPASDTSTGDEGGVWNSTSGVLTFPLGVGGTAISPTDVIRRVGVLAGVTAPGVATTVPVESFKNKLKFEASPSIRTVPAAAAVPGKPLEPPYKYALEPEETRVGA